MSRYINLLLKHELAALLENHLEITDKGRSFLDEYQKLAKMLH
jgi:predicted transcriptional regulator